jgi:hypothetical protein
MPDTTQDPEANRLLARAAAETTSVRLKLVRKANLELIKQLQLLNGNHGAVIGVIPDLVAVRLSIGDRHVSIETSEEHGIVVAPMATQDGKGVVGLVLDPVEGRWQTSIIDEEIVPTPGQRRSTRSAIAVVLETALKALGFFRRPASKC